MKIYGVNKGERPENTYCLRFEYQHSWGRNPRPLVVVPMPGDIDWTVMKNFIMENCSQDAWLDSDVTVHLEYADVLFEIHFENENDLQLVKEHYQL